MALADNGKIIVTGGTGFIGSLLVLALERQGYQVKVIARHRIDSRTIVLDLSHAVPPSIFEDAQAVIHLAGATLFRRWNERVKQEIYDSRVVSTRNLVSALKHVRHRPAVFISASAVGYYGDGGERILTEKSRPGEDFLARVCVDWEAEAVKAASLGIRTVQVRTAPVLGSGGLVSLLTTVYRLGVGGPIGSGQQWFPWISLDDVVAIYQFALSNSEVQGPLNACSPDLVRNRDFSTALAASLGKPQLPKIPVWLLRLLLGELSTVAAMSQRVQPEALLRLGYRFHYPDLSQTLRIIQK